MSSYLDIFRAFVAEIRDDVDSQFRDLLRICSKQIRNKLSFFRVPKHATARCDRRDSVAHASGNFPRRDKRQLNDARGLAM